jgi:hypothetical protein
MANAKRSHLTIPPALSGIENVLDAWPEG